MTTSERVRALLDYNATTGDLIWRRRGRSEFSSENAYATWNAKNAGKVAGCTDTSTGYRKLSIDGRIHLSHRVVWLHVHGQLPRVIDHQDGCRDNNKINNLRDVTSADNSRNAALRHDNSSGAPGVRFWAGKWRADIKVDGVTHSLGRFSDMAAAIEARMQASTRFGFHQNHGRQALAAAKSKTKRAA